eukprot:gb/GECG01007951.1/.p1 GENE.gb/GECG01007951.1/~~gb/GECG01007951.1/.p1  ORF type:complete len:104 (+),score=7.32 gb/GECG01007951.1/:1-312(+)
MCCNDGQGITVRVKDVMQEVDYIETAYEVGGETASVFCPSCKEGIFPACATDPLLLIARGVTIIAPSVQISESAFSTTEMSIVPTLMTTSLRDLRATFHVQIV